MDMYLDDYLPYLSTFNILVFGRPGVGKSAFINYLINSMSLKLKEEGNAHQVY